MKHITKAEKDRHYNEWILWLSILLALSIYVCCCASCTKSGYKPDWDQVTCKRVTYWQEPFTDSTGHGISLGDSTIMESVRFCTSSPYYTQEVTKAENFGVQWVRVCNSGGEILHFNKVYAIVKND